MLRRYLNLFCCKDDHRKQSIEKRISVLECSLVNLHAQILLMKLQDSPPRQLQRHHSISSDTSSNSAPEYIPYDEETHDVNLLEQNLNSDDEFDESNIQVEESKEDKNIDDQSSKVEHSDDWEKIDIS